MNRFLLVVALLAAWSSPALAGCGRAKHAEVYTAPEWVHPIPHSQHLANALGGWNRGYPADPYWEPCLSYERSWGPGACGGSGGP
jgi:hypothetical protein